MSSSIAPAHFAADREVVRLRCSFQAPSLRHATLLAGDVRGRCAEVTTIGPSPAREGRRYWTVTLNAPPLPLTVDALRDWEREMLAVEHSRPGCRFLGWSVLGAGGSFDGPVGRSEAPEGRRPPPRQTQRELVTASLLRCPPGGRRGVVHGRAA
jgi:hypothetical protein